MKESGASKSIEKFLTRKRRDSCNIVGVVRGWPYGGTEDPKATMAFDIFFSSPLLSFFFPFPPRFFIEGRNFKTRCASLHGERLGNIDRWTSRECKLHRCIVNCLFNKFFERPPRTDANAWKRISSILFFCAGVCRVERDKRFVILAAISPGIIVLCMIWFSFYLSKVVFVCSFVYIYVARSFSLLRIAFVKCSPFVLFILWCHFNSIWYIAGIIMIRIVYPWHTWIQRSSNRIWNVWCLKI